MLGRRFSRKVPSRISSGDRSPAAGALAGTASPLERNPRSPKGWRKRESDGVGLGIVAKLERAGSGGGRPWKILMVGPASAPIPIGSSRASESAAAGEYCEVADFLSCCYLCRKMLHGKDIYMYRGEKAFCSMECRYQQIVSDEFLEKCGSEVLRRADVSSSPCSGCGDRGRLFFTGVMAA